MKRSTKYASRVVALLLLLALVGWVASRWNVWFYNPPEVAVQPLHVPGHVLLTFGEQDGMSRNVSWQCDTMLQPSWLVLVCDGDTSRIKADGEVFESRNGKAAYYVARLRQLKPNGHYRYCAVTGGKHSTWHAFNTYPEQRDRFSFMFVGDVQDTIGGISNRLLLEAWAHHPQVEFLVCGGDLIERPANQYWDETFRDLDSIGQSMPILNITGNHDYLKGVVRRLEYRFPLVFSYFLDSRIGDNMVYTLNYGNLQLFVLDSNREFFHLWSQRQWLKEQLRSSKAKWKVLFLHHPLYSIKGHNNLVQRWMFDDLVRDYGIDLVMQGHEHAYARMTARDGNGKAIAPVYTISHCSPKNYRISFDDRFDKYGISSRYYQTVTLQGDTLAMATYDANTHSLYDSLLIVTEGLQGGSHQVIDMGKDIPECMDFVPQPGNKKDLKFAERIGQYVNRHPERMSRHSRH